MDNIDKFLHESLENTYKNKMLIMNMVSEEKLNISDTLVRELYKTALEKTKGIDYGDIPKSKGDFYKYKDADSIIKSLDFIDKINNNTSLELASSTKTINKSINILHENKIEFQRGFSEDNEMVKFIYNNILLSIITAINLLIVNTVEYIRTPDGNYETLLVHSGRKSSLEYQIFKNLENFNRSVEKGELNKLFSNMKKNSKGFTGATVFITTIMVVVVIIPLIREMIYFFYNTRTKLANRLELMSVMLIMNDETINKNNEFDQNKRQKIIEKQHKLAQKFNNLANVIKVDFETGAKKTEVDLKEKVGKSTIDNLTNTSAIL